MNLLARVQTDLEALLKARFPKLDVQAFPDQPRQFKAKHPVATVLIGYSGARDSAPRDSGRMVQERVTRWDISVLARALNGEEGAVALIEAIRVSLCGRRAGGGEILLREDRFRGHDASIWEYSLSLEITLLTVPPADEEVAPHLSRIVSADRDGDPAGSVPPPHFRKPYETPLFRPSPRPRPATDRSSSRAIAPPKFPRAKPRSPSPPRRAGPGRRPMALRRARSRFSQTRFQA